jgi:hypothetical protein
VIKNKLMKEIFGSIRKKVTGGWRILCNKKLQNMYSSSNIIRLMTWQNEKRM